MTRTTPPSRGNQRNSIVATFVLTVLSSHSAHAATFTLEEATLTDVQQAMDAGALSSVELTTLYLNRIHTYDSHGIKLNAISVVICVGLGRIRRRRSIKAAPMARTAACYGFSEDHSPAIVVGDDPLLNRQSAMPPQRA